MIERILAVAAIACVVAQGGDTPKLIPTSPEQQAAIYKRLAAKTYLARKATDADGNLIWICLNHMPPYRKKKPDAPGLLDADMKLLLHFPKLQGVTIQGQGLTDEGYKVLAAFPDLVVASLPNPAKPFKRPDDVPQPSKDFILPLANCRKLQVLDITHTFGIRDSALPQMPGFPELRFLSVDVGHSGPDLLKFLAKCPKIEVLRLHRTPMSDADLKTVLELCPKLRFLMIKRGRNKKDPITARSLRHFQQHKKIEIVQFSHNPPALPWTDGLEHLLYVPNLKLLATKPETTYRQEDFDRLRQERPDLEIAIGKSSRAIMPKVVPDYDWQIGPR